MKVVFSLLPKCPDAQIALKQRRQPLGSLAELDTQFIIAEKQGYAAYTNELRAEIMGLIAGIRKFYTTL